MEYAILIPMFVYTLKNSSNSGKISDSKIYDMKNILVVLSNHQSMQRSKANKYISAIISSDDIHISIDWRKNAPSDNICFKKAALSEQKLISIAASIDLITDN